MRSCADNSPKIERRSGLDRRKRKTAILSKYWLMGKRSVVRREEDRQKPYRLDRHSHKILSVILLVIMLSILDAALTLVLISHGATEINPIMAYFLNHGPLVFFWSKYLLTCTCLFIILVNTNYYIFGNKIRVKIVFVFFVPPFLLVITWELYMIMFML